METEGIPIQMSVTSQRRRTADGSAPHDKILRQFASTQRMSTTTRTAVEHIKVHLSTRSLMGL
jgi:hypothetical protein